MVQTADSLRTAALGKDHDGNIDNGLGVFFTRTLVHWGFYMMTFGANRSPYESFEFSFLGSIDNDEIEEVNSVVQRVWGDEINKPLAS